MDGEGNSDFSGNWNTWGCSPQSGRMASEDLKKKQEKLGYLRVLSKDLKLVDDDPTSILLRLAYT